MVISSLNCQISHKDLIKTDKGCRVYRLYSGVFNVFGIVFGCDKRHHGFEGWWNWLCL